MQLHTHVAEHALLHPDATLCIQPTPCVPRVPRPQVTMLRIHKLDKETGKPTADPEAIDRWAPNCGPLAAMACPCGCQPGLFEPPGLAQASGNGSSVARDHSPTHTALPPAPPPPSPRFARKLKKVTAEQGARFVSYDAASGTWKFEVEHFSKYGLDSEEDSDDEELQVYGVRGRAAAAAAARQAAAARGVADGERAAAEVDEDGMEDSKLAAAGGAPGGAAEAAAAAAAAGNADASSRAVQLSSLGCCPL